jgi:protease-4
MIQFLKYVLATIVGLFLFSVLSIFLLAGIGSAFSSSSSETSVAENSVLKIDLNQVVTENAAEEDPFSEIFSDGPGKIGLVDIKESYTGQFLKGRV